MKDHLTIEDINQKVVPKISNQSYSPKPTIEDVKIATITKYVVEDGDFAEILRINSQQEAEQFPGFKIAQINRTKLFPKSVKAWHVHFNQDEIWYVTPSDHIFVGLWDIRKDSKTNGLVSRIPLGGGNSQLLFVPKGVAHGVSNFLDRPVDLFYFVNQQFDRQNPDEKRLAWDIQGADFWQPTKD